MSTKSSYRILLVDDDPDVLRDYASALRRIGEVVEAPDGTSALARITEMSFDVIVSDVAMPGISGIDLLSHVRRHDLDVPVVLITGQVDLASATRALEYGALGYLIKPVSLEKLWQTVRRASEMHKLARTRRQTLTLEGSQGKSLGDPAALRARFQPALDGLWVAYQPIVSWRKKEVVGYEALARSAEPSLQSPVDLFDAAERLNRLQELGRSLRALIEQMARRAAQEMFFVNIHSSDLSDPGLYAPTSPLAQIAPRVVLEVTERAALSSVNEVARKVARLRDLGFRLALDDLGAGYAGLSSFAVLEPSFVKIDRTLVQGISQSSHKQEIIRSILHLCEAELGIPVICEGVETTVERDSLVELGADFLQGFLFGTPTPRLQPAQW